MLDFLELNEAGKILIACCVPASILGGIACGLVTSAGKEKKGLLRMLISGVCGSLAIFTCIPILAASFLLMFPVGSGQLLKSASIGGTIGFFLFFLFHKLMFRIRRKQFLRNDMMRQIVRHCKDQNIVGIQCFPDRVRFFNTLKNAEYCQDTQITHCLESDYNVGAYQKLDFRPPAWKAYDSAPALVGELIFAKQNYPDVPDVNLFATSLAMALGGCRVVSHGTAIRYFYNRIHNITGKRERINYIVYTYQDKFVYKKRALKALWREKSRMEKEAAAQRKAAKKKSNQWN